MGRDETRDRGTVANQGMGAKAGPPRIPPPNPGAQVDGDRRFGELMARYCDGEVAAFDELYAGLAPRLLGYLRAMAGDRSTAEDLLQLTFMKLHQGRAAYIRGANPIPWLYTIAHRACIDDMRRRRRSRVRLSSDGQLPHEPAADVTGRPAQETCDEDQDAVARGLAALATLPEPLRQAVVLIKLDGRSSAEAASIVGITVSAVKVRAHRGYVALRKLLGGAGEPAGTVAADEPAAEVYP